MVYAAKGNGRLAMDRTRYYCRHIARNLTRSYRWCTITMPNENSINVRRATSAKQLPSSYFDVGRSTLVKQCHSYDPVEYIPVRDTMCHSHDLVEYIPVRDTTKCPVTKIADQVRGIGSTNRLHKKRPSLFYSLLQSTQNTLRRGGADWRHHRRP